MDKGINMYTEKMEYYCVKKKWAIKPSKDVEEISV